MTYQIPGCTTADHAKFFGPDWYEETDEDQEPTRRKTMSSQEPYGQHPKCHVCQSQIRPVDNPKDTDCRNPDAKWESNTCTGWTPASHRTLALRIAELYNQLSIVWDVAMITLDNSSKLPEVPE